MFGYVDLIFLLLLKRFGFCRFVDYCCKRCYQVRQLHSRIEAYELELEQFELVKSDWQMEKESLEGVLVKLRSELREKEEVLNIVHAQKVMCFVISLCTIFSDM